MKEPRLVPEVEPTSYYGRPVIKAPVWKWAVPAYMFAGGMAGASSVLATGARLAANPALARRARWTASVAIAAGAALLVEDLGRPERFRNMLRVAKPTSPMSMGSWLLTVYGPAAALAAAGDLLGLPRALTRLADWLAAAAGPVVATYTAVLVSDTAVPAWYGARRELPFVFAGAAATAAGGAALVTTTPMHVRPARAFALLGAATELGASQLARRRLGEVGEVYRQGRAGALDRLATLLTGVGGVVTWLWGRRRIGAAVGGASLVAGSLAKRFAVLEAGIQSANDPKYTIGPQRRTVEPGRTGAVADAPPR
ncbi:MAG: polysulfide reductase [Actinobacteria bacterium]|nr:MAG: polysulfide reductase [Actinomycetota bacterium]